MDKKQQYNYTFMPTFCQVICENKKRKPAAYTAGFPQGVLNEMMNGMLFIVYHIVLNVSSFSSKKATHRVTAGVLS